MRKRVFLMGFVLILCCSFCSLKRSVSSLNRELVRTTGYQLDVRIDYEHKKIEADCHLTVFNPFDYHVRQIPIVLYRLMKVTSVHDKQGHELSFNQQVVSYEDWEILQVNFVEVRLNRPLAPNEKTSIKISYNGYLAGYTETGMIYVKDNVDPNYTVIRPDCWAYPQVGFPSWKINRSAGLKEFDYKIRVTVPEHLVVANGGRLIEKFSRNGETTYVYENILPAWRIDIAVAEYDLLEEPRYGMKVFYFKDDKEGATRILNGMKDCFELYANWFWPLAARIDFSVIAVPEGYGSQADVTSVLQTRNAFLDKSRMIELYHEISHLWNVKPLDALPPRFESEGLAMFLQFLTQEQLEGTEGALNKAAIWMFEYFKNKCRENPKLLEVPMIDYGQERLTNFSYSQGMLFFYVLCKKAGKEALIKAVGSVYQTYHNTGVSTRDFLAHLKNELGLELDSFYQAWIFSTEAAHDICNLQSLDDLINKYIQQ